MKPLAFTLGIMLAAAQPAFATEKASAAYEDGQHRPALYVLDDLVTMGLMSTSDVAVWFHKYADDGIAEAQYNLGVLYERGDGVPKDEAKALELYRLAAAQEFAEAKYNLGVMHHEGRGVRQDHAEAAKWYRKAAEKGLPDAKYNLGLLYHKGIGVPHDDAEAQRWHRSASGEL